MISKFGFVEIKLQIQPIELVLLKQSTYRIGQYDRLCISKMGGK